MQFIAQINTPHIENYCKGIYNLIDNQTAMFEGNIIELVSIATEIDANDDAVFFKSEADLTTLDDIMDLRDLISYLTNQNNEILCVLKGEWIVAGGENILTPKDIYKLDTCILEKSLANMLAYRVEINKTIINWEHKKMDANSEIVMSFFKHIEKIKVAIEKQSFTDTFEACMKLKLYLVSKDNHLSFFCGDSDLGLILNAISLKFTSTCFDYLEMIETQHKELFTSKFKQLK